MKIIFVPSGGYKAFYLNCFLKIQDCDLLVFNFGVIYDVDADNNERNLPVFNELKFLSSSLNCPVVAGVFTRVSQFKKEEKFRMSQLKKGDKSVKLNSGGKLKNDAKSLFEKTILVCDKEKIKLTCAHDGARIFVQDKAFFVADEMSEKCNFNKIILSKRRIRPHIQACNERKIYLFCDDFGVTMVKNKKITRKFNKFPKIILN